MGLGDFWTHVCFLSVDGVWDSGIKSLGPYAYAHTNLTEINLSLELLWRNNIDPARVNMGLGFYGRSMSSPFPFSLLPPPPLSLFSKKKTE